MKDRVPRYPGRVKMTPVAGQANTFDMVRADDPTQEGTPLNKTTLLKDATAALFGLGANAVPDDAFVAIKTMFDGRVRLASGTYVGTGNYGEDNKNSLTFPFPPKVVLIFRVAGMGLMTGSQASNLDTDISYSMIAAYPASSTGVIGRKSGTSAFVTNILSFSGNSMSWYSSGFGPTDKSGAAKSQLNESGVEYRYYAIGGGDY